MEASAINSGDTAWVLISSALVLMMTAPALAFFYGGMVRKKNVLSTLNLSFILMGLISVQWVLFGYSLAFGPDIKGFIGDLSWSGLTGVDAKPFDAYSKTIPHLVFCIFQMMFAVITPALITGTIVDRVKFKAFLLFSLLWSTVVYDPLAHWVWGDGGWLKTMGALDFAGGTVVHIAAGFSALAFALALGPRKGYPVAPMEPHNIPFVVLGAGLLWVGWFGFNAGSALAADGLAAYAFINTNTAAAAAALSWMVVSWATNKPSVLGIATGAVVGLVAVTPAAGFVTPMGAMLIGFVAAPISFYAMRLRQTLKLDDSLDVWACHGMGGLTGALMTGLLATKAVNEAGADGLLYGNPGQFWIQIVACATTIGFVFVVTFVLVKIIDAIVGLRVTAPEEEVGLDLSEHGERAYS